MKLCAFVARMSVATSGASLAQVPRGKGNPGYRCAHPGYDTVI